MILEAKQVGDVYHFTSLKRAKGILDSNKIKNSWLESDKPYVSTTRDKNFAKNRYGSQYQTGGNPELAFILDGNKLSDKYKSSPYNEPEHIKDDDPGASELYGDEMEERWTGKLIGRDRGIGNIKQYITGVIITGRLLDKLMGGGEYGKSIDPSISSYEMSPVNKLKIIKQWLNSHGINNIKIVK